MRAALLALLALIASGCVDLAWKEGIACDHGRCPGALTCCGNGTCWQTCSPDASGVADGPPEVVVCPSEPGACYGCMPGCACTCLGQADICCLKVGVATCGGCE